jgi:hypothetical protein
LLVDALYADGPFLAWCKYEHGIDVLVPLPSDREIHRDLKEGWGLKAQRWSRNVVVQRGRVTLTCLAFNTAQVYLSRAGKKRSAQGIRRLRYEYFSQLGPSPAVIYIGRSYAVFPWEELLRLLHRSPRHSLAPRLPSLRPP